MKNLFTIALFFLFASSALSEPCKDLVGEELINCLKEQICTHKPEPLSYVDFNNLFVNNRISPKQADELINYAYSEKIMNPILFRRAREEVDPEQYSLNFLWIHKDKLTEKGHLMGKNDEDFNSKVLSPLLDWSSKQPEANINFWYDGDIAGFENVQNTEKLISSIPQLVGKRIRFRNIRDIPFVGKNTNLFHPKVPVYFRVDLAKAIIADHVMRADKLIFVVNIDADIIAIIRAQLFDERTLYALKNIGYAFGGAPAAREENSFIMLHNAEDLGTLKAHYETIIDLAKSRVEKRLTRGWSPDSQEVFYLYPYFMALMKGKFKNRNGKDWESQNIQISGKAMIFPQSQFALAGGYEKKIIEQLKNALSEIPSKTSPTSTVKRAPCPLCGY